VAGDWPRDDHEMRLGAQGDLHFPIFLTPSQDCNNFATACEERNSPAVPEVGGGCHLGSRTLNSVFLGS
jgi:hypothetical protein